MSNLTGQQIKDTYQGLLNLQDSTTGITNSFQTIQDGLGNDTGLKIRTNELNGSGLLTYKPYKSQYYGGGFQNAVGAQYAAGTQNIIMAVPFYDNGVYEYSAVSINTVQTTSTSDTLEYAIYTSQMINPSGLFPETPIVSGMTASTTSTGIKTFTFPTNISMSGYGSGIYWIVYKISNSGVQPTFRPGATATALALSNTSQLQYGVILGFTTNTYTGQYFRPNNGAGSLMVFSGTSSFDNPYPTTIINTQSSLTNIAGNALGMILHTVGV